MIIYLEFIHLLRINFQRTRRCLFPLMLYLHINTLHLCIWSCRYNILYTLCSRFILDRENDNRSTCVGGRSATELVTKNRRYQGVKYLFSSNTRGKNLKKSTHLFLKSYKTFAVLIYGSLITIPGGCRACRY